MALGTLAANAQDTVFNIEGTAPAGTKMAYLINRDDRKDIDSTAVKDGRFAFSGKKNANTLLAVATDNNIMMFFCDGTPVEVDMDKETLKGSEVNAKLGGYMPLYNTYMSKMGDLREKYKEAGKKNDGSNADEIKAIVAEFEKVDNEFTDFQMKIKIGRASCRERV